MNRIELCQKKYESLFQNELQDHPTDKEFMDILQRFIFGEVFYVGALDDKLRELITVTILAVQQTLPQLKGHVGAALNIGNSPIEIRETIYQCAPFIGFPKTLNAIAVMNEVFTERKISLPLENQETRKDEERYEKGIMIQEDIYGAEIKDKYQYLPQDMGNDLSRFLTELCFGDFYTRKGLSVQVRELLVLCILATIPAKEQLYSHALGNLKVGNTLETMYAALIHCIPYIGFPNGFNAINTLKPLHEKINSTES